MEPSQASDVALIAPSDNYVCVDMCVYMCIYIYIHIYTHYTHMFRAAAGPRRHGRQQRRRLQRLL